MAAELSKFGSYEALDNLGTTNTGTVYRVRDERTQKIHMVKVLDPELIERAGGVDTIRADLDTIQSLRHPNVGRILETHLDSEPVYIVSEYVDGLPLRMLLQERRLTFAEGFRVFREVCAGLAAAHGKGLVHRDLNPKNVIVSRDLSTVKITDFGLGPLKDFSHEVSHGETGDIDARTLKYLAPEFLRDSTGDERSDIYSAGVLCYEALTGRTPAGRFSLPSQLNSDAPPELDPIVLRCLATDRGGRYTSADELIQDIRQLEERLRLGLAENLKGLAGLSSLGSQGSRTWRSVLLGIALLALIGLVFGLGISRKRAATELLRPSGATQEGTTPPSPSEPEETSTPAAIEEQPTESNV